MPFFNSDFQLSNVDLESVYVDLPALFAFKKGTSTQSQTDVLSFVLLPILAANKRYSAFDSPADWFGELHTTMIKVGFVVSGYWSISEIPSDTTLSRLALDKIDGDAHDAVEQAIEAIGRSGNEHPLQILNSAVGNRKNTAFLTGFASRDENASIVTIYGFFGKISKPNDHVLESGFKAGNSIDIAKMNVHFPDDMIAGRREEVMDKLGMYYDHLVELVKM
ncbi:hypothetical protein RSOLAG22IIIB_10740 [Rhizoctonia solani]|uniref:Uncharacterized protein n=1 Tax=Rhizoctonia solani TaxID=456999 RepID=A0A0K6G4E0_9AGAM|nr:hypothetical protein RSOLAG22IIIB_10740 [Rhizoctonia solani]